ncbi:MAG: thioredoxin family protein [Candidatus Aenigmatarchaeota archaeon]
MGKISLNIYIKAALLTALVFIAGIAVGWYLDSQRIVFLQSKIDELQISMSNLALEESFYKSVDMDRKTLCEIYTSKANEISVEAGKLGSYLESFKEISKFNVKEIEILKDKYFVSNLQLWLYMRRLREECNYSAVTILYFYTSVSKCEDCMAQGIVLDRLKKENPEKYMIFALDIDSNLGIVKALTKYFNVTSVPTVIINEKVKMEGFSSKEKIEEVVKNLL